SGCPGGGPPAARSVTGGRAGPTCTGTGAARAWAGSRPSCCCGSPSPSRWVRWRWSSIAAAATRQARKRGGQRHAPGRPPHAARALPRTTRRPAIGGRWDVVLSALDSWPRTFRLCLILLVTIVSPIAAAAPAVLIHHMVLRDPRSGRRPGLVVRAPALVRQD